VRPATNQSNRTNLLLVSADSRHSTLAISHGLAIGMPSIPETIGERRPHQIPAHKRERGSMAGLHRQLVKQTAARPTNGGKAAARDYNPSLRAASGKRTRTRVAPLASDQPCVLVWLVSYRVARGLESQLSALEGTVLLCVGVLNTCRECPRCGFRLQREYRTRADEGGRSIVRSDADRQSRCID
jgi:hypothetical protein